MRLLSYVIYYSNNNKSQGLDVSMSEMTNKTSNFNRKLKNIRVILGEERKRNTTKEGFIDIGEKESKKKGRIIINTLTRKRILT